MAVKQNHFNRGKPFYPLVINYLVQLHGHKEMSLRGALGTDRTAPADEQWMASLNLPPELRENIAKLRGPLKLRQTGKQDVISVTADDVAIELIVDHAYHLEVGALAALCGILILAWELTAAYHPKGRDNGPLWEFLRHVRNAAAHGGRLRFERGEPVYVAEWRGIRLTFAEHQGAHLLATNNRAGILSAADPIGLLWDIERAHPNLKVKWYTGAHR